MKSEGKGRERTDILLQYKGMVFGCVMELSWCESIGSFKMRRFISLPLIMISQKSYAILCYRMQPLVISS
jgi:hypothetical protein